MLLVAVARPLCNSCSSHHDIGCSVLVCTTKPTTHERGQRRAFPTPLYTLLFFFALLSSPRYASSAITATISQAGPDVVA